MVKIEISNMELNREILKTYIKSPSNLNASFDIIQSICKKLDVPISGNYCYISDLLKYLLETRTIVLNKMQCDLISSLLSCYNFNHNNRMRDYEIFVDLAVREVIPTGLLECRIGFVKRKFMKNIKENRT